MKLGSRRRCIANMRAVNEESASTSALAASVMLEFRLVAALCAGKSLTSFQYGRTMNSVLFESRFEKTLLKNLSKNRVIIMDNTAFHKKEVLYQIAKKYSQTFIFLPPYSPEYNPIEHTWSALKRNIVSQIHRYSSVAEVVDAVLQGK